MKSEDFGSEFFISKLKQVKTSENKWKQVDPRWKRTQICFSSREKDRIIQWKCHKEKGILFFHHKGNLPFSIYHIYCLSILIFLMDVDESQSKEAGICRASRKWLRRKLKFFGILQNFTSCWGNKMRIIGK